MQLRSEPEPLLRVVRPSIELESAFLDAAREYRDADEEVDPAFPIYWQTPFDQYVIHLERFAQGDHAPFSTVPFTTFWLFDATRGRILGSSQIRHKLTPELEHEGGHIGYSIRPSERGKGMGALLCALTLDEARRLLDIDRILITCDTANRASAMIIEKNGGVLINEVVSNRTGNRVSRYWIALRPEAQGKARA